MDQKIPEPLSKPVEPTKPRANVAPEQAHAAMATSTPMGTPAANVGKSSKVKSLLIGFIILLLAVGCVSMGYMLWKAQRDIDILNADHKAALEEMDKKRAELEAQIKEMKGGESGSDEETANKNDVIRKSDLNAIASGLEQYYNDNQAYPAAMTDLTAGNYLKEIPTDPRSNNSYTYTPLPNTGPPYTSFTLQATLENQNDKDIKSGTTDTYEVVNKQ